MPQARSRRLLRIRETSRLRELPPGQRQGHYKKEDYPACGGDGELTKSRSDRSTSIGTPRSDVRCVSARAPSRASIVRPCNGEGKRERYVDRVDPREWDDVDGLRGGWKRGVSNRSTSSRCRLRERRGKLFGAGAVGTTRPRFPSAPFTRRTTRPFTRRCKESGALSQGLAVAGERSRLGPSKSRYRDA